MSVLLLQLDGKLPNLALMRAARVYRERGYHVVLRRAGNAAALAPHLNDPCWDVVLGSLIFERTRPLAELARASYPSIVLGGTGWDVASDLDRELAIGPGPVDYSDYPAWSASLGFTQRGCRMRCSFCVVPRKEGAVRQEATIADLWRGEPWPRELILLDNDFFGQLHWRERVDELQRGRYRVSFTQGINARMLTDETAAALASLDYRDDSMRARRLYTAWDNRGDEGRLFRGLEALVRHGVKPRDIMVYMLVGYWAGETADDRDYRRRRLREFGAVPYPMPYVRTPELIGFQRWIVGAYDKRVTWPAWKAAGYRPERLGDRRQMELTP